MMEWITDWSRIDDRREYIVCPINARDDKTLYLGQPKRMPGWEVKSLLKHCYAAIPFPEFRGLPEATGS